MVPFAQRPRGADSASVLTTAPTTLGEEVRVLGKTNLFHQPLTYTKDEEVAKPTVSNAQERSTAPHCFLRMPFGIARRFSQLCLLLFGSSVVC